MDLTDVKNLLSNLNGDIYLVGGMIRNYLLEKKFADVDLVVQKNPQRIAKQFANQVDGSFVELDISRGMYRVVTSDLNYDFSLLTGDFIKEDLKRRDFTINALALKINDSSFKLKQLIDPYQGLKDLRQGIIKVVTASSFVDDPLRILRCVRFKAQFQFVIDPTTYNLAADSVTKLNQVANERIKDELLKILSYPKAASSLDYLKELGVLEQLIPKFKQLKIIGPCKYHQEDVWTHSLFAVQQVEELLKEDYWKDKISKEKIPLLKLAALFHDYGKLFTEEKINGQIHFYGHHKDGAKKMYQILKRLSFSNWELNYIIKLIRYHMRPLALYYADNLTFKGKHRFFKAGAGFVEDICLLAAADKMSTAKLNQREEEISGSIDFLKELIAEKEDSTERTSKKIIDGNDLMKELGLSEGPKVGEILDLIEEKQAQGKISNYQQALEYAEKLKKEV